MFIDTHTHFYDEWLLPDAEAAVQRALEAGVGKMIQADIDSKERPFMWEIGNRHPGVIYQMLGLYPGSVAADWKEELDLVYSIADGGSASSVAIDKDSIVSIGEIGLDYHEGLDYVQEQKEVLRLQMELAAKLDLPVNIHLRDAWEDFFKVLADCKHLHLRGNLHCFTASYEIYEQANRYGEFSVLETDAPYLAPVPHRGHRNESAYLPHIARKVAEIKGLPIQEIENITTPNAISLFDLSPFPEGRGFGRG